jgi:hypothetical protein
MKKSMLALFGCALVAGSVMAAEVTGNNTAVVIKNTPVVSSNLYQFLIVPVKGFDIKGKGEGQSLSLDEILPPNLYDPDTIVYENGTANVMKVNQANQWVKEDPTKEFDPIYGAGTILWLQSPATVTDTDDIPPTVFCGELSTTAVTVTPITRQFVPFGNATSTAVKFKDITVGGGTPSDGDEIYRLKDESGDYDILRYNGTLKVWTKKPGPTEGIFAVDASNDELPAGVAAYYYRR